MTGQTQVQKAGDSSIVQSTYCTLTLAFLFLVRFKSPAVTPMSTDGIHIQDVQNKTSRTEVSVPRHNHLESHGTSLSPNPKMRIVTFSAYESSVEIYADFNRLATLKQHILNHNIIKVHRFYASK